MAEGELRIKSDSIEKTTSAITALIGKLEDLDKNLDKVAKSTNDQAVSQNKSNTALKAAEIARKKAVDMLELHKQGLGKLSDAYAEEQAAIKAREIAAKKNIELGSKEYQQLLDNVKATELASAASKRLALEEAEKARELTRAEKADKQAEQSTTKKTASEVAAEKALNSSNISRETSIRLLKLEEKGLDRLSDEYAEQKGAILGAQQAKLKGIKAGTTEYNQLIKNTTAIEKSTAARKRLQAAEAKGTKGANGFTDSLDDMAKQAALVDGPLGGIASRLTTLSTILKSTGGLGGALALTGAGIGLAVFTQQLVKGIGVASDTEVSMKTLEAQIRATGGAAGYTANQLDLMARSIARNTLDSTESVRKSIQSLLSYTNISSTMFEDVVRKSQDLAIVTSKSTRTVVSQLGKVLDDPINNLEALKELRLKIAPEEKQAIKNLQSEGKLYEAQSVILNKISKTYGDVAREQANATLAGDVDTLGQNWEELFETLGSGTNGPLRDLVQGLNSAVESLTEIAETGVETGIRKMRQELQDASETSESTTAFIAKLDEEINTLEKSTGELTFGDKVSKGVGEATLSFGKFLKNYSTLAPLMDDEISQGVREDLLLTDREKRQKVLLQIKEEAIEKQRLQNGAVGEYIPLLTEAQQKARDLADTELSKQTELTRILIETGDTRNRIYLEAKAAQDALTEAQKRGLVVDEESLKKVISGGEVSLGYQEKELKAIFENKKALSLLTEERVTHNTILQKTKSLQSQQSGMEREIALYKATTSGILENSEAYIHLAASLKTANEIKQMGGDVSSEQAKALYQENLEVLKLQKSISVLNAIKAGDSNSSNIQTLDRQIKLQKALTEGVSKNSREYILLEEELKAVDRARSLQLDSGSEEYKQLIKNAEAIAAKRIELQRFNDLAEMGVSFSLNGNSQIEGTLSQLTDSLPRELSKIDAMVISAEDLIDGKKGISQETADELKERIKERFADEKNQILMPLGFFVDSEGAIQAAEELNLVQEELKAKERELKELWREEDLITEEQYLERKRLLNIDYEQKIADAKADAHEKSSEHIALMKAKEVSSVIQGGVEMLAAVSNNNKKLMKIAKAMSVFNASVSLVDALAEAYKAGWPLDIPLAAKALTQGTALIAQAKSLNEPSFAFGGVDIQGAGTGRSDSISANIARGESVMTAPATARYKDTLQRMNAGLPIRQGGNSTFKSSPIINIQGDASERTVGISPDSATKNSGSSTCILIDAETTKFNLARFFP